MLLKLSSHLNQGLPLGLLSCTTPSNALMVHLSLPILSSLPFHSSCLFTISNTPTCPSLRSISSFVTRSFQHAPSILLNAFICVAWTLDLCSFRSAHAHIHTLKLASSLHLPPSAWFTQFSPPQDCLAHSPNNSRCTNLIYELTTMINVCVCVRVHFTPSSSQ